MSELYSYIIDHTGQPCITNRKLVLSECKPSLDSKNLKKKRWIGIRYGAKKGDWVIATLGKNYDVECFGGELFSNHGKNPRFFLVYAMKVTIEPDSKNTIRKPLKSSHFFIPKRPMPIPESYHEMASRGRQYRHLKYTDDAKLIDAFESWIEGKMHKYPKSTKFNCPKKTLHQKCKKCN